MKDFENITGLPDKMMNITLKELVSTYGGVMRLEKWANTLEKLLSASYTEMVMLEEKGKLIDRDFVIQCFNGFLGEVYYFLENQEYRDDVYKIIKDCGSDLVDRVINYNNK
jgi:hypothetical protein